MTKSKLATEIKENRLTLVTTKSGDVFEFENECDMIYVSKNGRIYKCTDWDNLSDFLKEVKNIKEVRRLI